MKTLHIFRDDFTAEQTWDLLDWCISRGADDFTAVPMGVGSAAGTISRKLQPFNLGYAKRHLFGNTLESVPVWKLNSQSISLLRSLLDGGLFTYDVGDDE